MNETPICQEPKKEEKRWFIKHYNNFDYYNASIEDLEKYYKMAVYYKGHTHVTIKDEDSINISHQILKSNREIISQILSIRSSEKVENISVNSLKVSKTSIFIACVTLVFAVGAFYMSWKDYEGDAEWQRQQVCELKKIAKSELSEECKE